MTPDDLSGVEETHISWVFLAGDRAYKRLKPVVMPFFDHVDDARRIDAATREFELNARISPDVYLGLADVREGNDVVDRMIVMRRLPADRRLSSILASGDGSDCLRGVARALAVFHARQPPVQPAPMAAAAALQQNWTENLAVTDQLEDVGVSRHELDRVRMLAFEYLEGRTPLFDDRVAKGFVRDGHGDLIADDVFCLDDGPRIIDCLAFRDDWRIADVLLDIGFLVMDVHRIAGRTAAQRLLGWYQEFSGEQHPSSLSHHYVAYRAHVRSKVACLRWQQGDTESAEVAREYHDLALHHLEHGRVRLILVGGGPGAGKTNLSKGLADRLGGVSLSTDEIRTDVAGLSQGGVGAAAPGQGQYTDAARGDVYAEQLREAKTLLHHGETVVLDASWASDSHRTQAREVACETRAALCELECHVDRQTALTRLANRRDDPFNVSDATEAVLDHLGAHRDPWPEAAALDTNRPSDAVLDAACQIVMADRNG